MIALLKRKLYLAIEATILLSGTAVAKGLVCGSGAMTPMEARLERASGNRSAQSTRIQNAQRASREIQTSVPGSTVTSQGEKVSYRQVAKTGCCKSKQTITASGGAKVGVGKTKADAADAARSNKSGGKVTW